MSPSPAFTASSELWLAEFNQEKADSGLLPIGLLSADVSNNFAKDFSSGLAVIFQGVLYNQSALAFALDSDIAPPASAAQLILELYRKKSDLMLAHLRGIYSVLIWDPKIDGLIAFRDPLGFCPLFYAAVGASIFFSNSIDSLLSHPNVPCEINRAAMADYLCRRWPEHDETYFTAIKRVLLGHYLECTKGKIQTRQYWDPSPPGTPDNSFSENDLGEFDHYLEQAVQRTLIYGHAGIYLSGGLDSVSVAAMATDLARKQGYQKPLALSLAFPDPESNEEDIQRSVAAGLGIEQIIVRLNEAIGENGLLYGTLLTADKYPHPLQNPWRIAYNNLALMGKNQGVDVILTGIGGDDWLAVNLDYMADLIQSLDIIGMKQMIGAMLKSYHAPRLQVIRYLLWTIGLRPVISSNGRRVLNTIAPTNFTEYRRKRMLKRAETPDWVAPDPGLRKQLEMRTQKTIEKNLLKPEPSGPYGFYKHEARSATFSHPILTLELEEDFEVGRQLGMKLLHPYWDPDLIQFLCRIPPRLLLSGGREKGVVRQAIANRFPGLGFEKQRKVIAGSFIQNLMKSNGKVVYNKYCGLQRLTEFGIIDNISDQFIEQILASPDLVDNFRIWEFLTMESWLRSHS